MDQVAVFCHVCEYVSPISRRDIAANPRCTFCGSDFIELLSDSEDITLPPEIPPIPLRPTHERPFGDPAEYPYSVIPTEDGFPILVDPTNESEEPVGFVDEPLMLLRPVEELRQVEQSTRGAALAPLMNHISQLLRPSRSAASETAIRSLRRECIRGRNHELIGETCVVCHEQYKTDDTIVRLPCDHVFHEDCVMRWLNDHNTCPVCRYNLSATNNSLPQQSNTNRGFNVGSYRHPVRTQPTPPISSGNSRSRENSTQTLIRNGATRSQTANNGRESSRRVQLRPRLELDEPRYYTGVDPLQRGVGRIQHGEGNRRPTVSLRREIIAQSQPYVQRQADRTEAQFNRRVESRRRSNNRQSYH
eukprot:g8282.t1